mmetsp:Transcript_8933/g.26252  ORF Transcript_8933/g.26252 Transcript_8933/m.26252 type:complete len:187 (-) Transcript_8933:50-610(-)
MTAHFCVDTTEVPMDSERLARLRLAGLTPKATRSRSTGRASKEARNSSRARHQTRQVIPLSIVEEEDPPLGQGASPVQARAASVGCMGKSRGCPGKVRTAITAACKLGSTLVGERSPAAPRRPTLEELQEYMDMKVLLGARRSQAASAAGRGCGLTVSTTMEEVVARWDARFLAGEPGYSVLGATW